MDPDASDRSVRLGLDDPLAGLATWLAEGRVDDAAAARARQRSLQRQAEEDQSFHRQLIGLAESRSRVVLTTRASVHLSGLLTGVGRDFVVIMIDDAGEVLVPVTSIVAVRAGDRHEQAGGHRGAPRALAQTVADCLAELSTERVGVVLTAGAERIRGHLLAAGRDVVKVAVGGSPPEVVRVPIAALDHVRLVGG